ncbi:MBL fold metallo-hydrolase [Novosphingobium organovorum]|uniref:MBL fold metallo-hydrolase n=1 Tax=Novosphingobium organovorum TaxID=2930092 RepID=UPI00389904CC
MPTGLSAPASSLRGRGGETTGAGNAKPRPFAPYFEQLPSCLARLAALGVRPEAVDFVLHTHLHVDHVGRNTRRVDGRQAIPGFSFHSTPGHSAAHAAIVLESQGAQALSCGDALHHPVQVAEPDLLSIFDAAPDKTQRSRRWVLNFAADERARVFSCVQRAFRRVLGRNGRAPPWTLHLDSCVIQAPGGRCSVRNLSTPPYPIALVSKACAPSMRGHADAFPFPARRGACRRPLHPCPCPDAARR